MSRPSVSRRADRIPESSVQPGRDSVSPIHLANVLSHRLGSLVSGIVGFTDLLLDRLGDAEQRELAMRVLESAQRIEHVLADLSHFTRPITPEIEPVTVESVVDDVIRVLSDAVAERIAIDLAEWRRREVMADPFLARDALMFLLQNAAEACPPPAPIVLRADSDAASRTISLVVENEAHLDPETELRMFQPFFTTKARNLGVGLSMARRYARMQLGEVSLDRSVADGRVAFRFTLPAHRVDVTG